MISPLAATNAYKSQLKLGGDVAEESGSSSGGQSFGKLLQNQMNDFVNSQQQAETAKERWVSG